MADSREIPPNLIRKLFVIISFIKNLIVIIILSVPEFIKCFIEIVVPAKKKCVRGWTVLITGGGNGIGKLMAEELAQEGCNVALVDIDGNAARDTAENLRKYNIKAFGYQVDVSNAKAVENIKDTIEKDIGPVDMLVNNAGILTFKHTFDETDENIRRVIEVNINHSFYTTRVFLPGMVERKKGHIVTTSSAAAHHPMAFTLLYSSTKFGVTGFALSLEEELRQQGLGETINATIIYPYMIATRKKITQSATVFFPMLDPVDAIKMAVEGVLRNQRHVYVPTILNLAYKARMLTAYDVSLLLKSHLAKDKLNYKKSVQRYVKKKKLETKLTAYIKVEE